MKNIGSKQAELLARKEFGKRTYVARIGKRFEVGVVSNGLCFSYGTRLVKGTGKSWAEALSKAGIELPVDAPVAGGGE
jgi:hypothetical protein